MTPPESPPSPRVTIAIPTFRRRERLARLLDELPGQRRAAETAHGVTTSIVVIDNDPERSAREVVDGQDAVYVTEPTPGLAAVRNAAIDAAGDADALVFIDDDETPEPGWLASLVGQWRAGGSEFVSGRVSSTFAEPVDPWIEAGGFFRRVTFAPEERMPFAATNNLLIDLGFLRAHGLRFDPAFSLSGGEDIRITSQAVALGARITACPDALVLDPVPTDRATRSWVLRRAFRVGTTTARCDLALRTGVAERLMRRVLWLALGVGRIVAGAGRWLVGVLTRRLVHEARGARLVARGAGMTVGAFGLRYREYRARHTAAGRIAVD